MSLFYSHQKHTKPHVALKPSLKHERMRGCLVLVAFQERGGNPRNLITNEVFSPSNSPAWTSTGYTTYSASGQTWDLPSSDDTNSPIHNLTGDATFVYRARANVAADQWVFSKHSGLYQWAAGFTTAFSNLRLQQRFPGAVTPSNTNLTAGQWYTVCTSIKVNSSAFTYVTTNDNYQPLLSDWGVSHGGTVGTPSLRNGTLCIGAIVAGSTTNDLDGDIDFIRIYNRAMQPAEQISIVTDPWLEWRRPLPVWVNTGAAPAAPYQGISIVGLPV